MVSGCPDQTLLRIGSPVFYARKSFEAEREHKKPLERHERVCMGHFDTKACSHKYIERRTKNTSGFTLLELVIVIFLATLITGLTAVFFAHSLSSARIDAAGRELSAAIRHARLVSQIKGEDHTLVINLDTMQYGLAGRTMKTLPPDIAIRVNDPFEGEIRRGIYSIRFRAYGGMEGSTIILQQRKKAIYIQTDPVVGSVAMK